MGISENYGRALAADARRGPSGWDFAEKVDGRIVHHTMQGPRTPNCNHGRIVARFHAGAAGRLEVVVDWQGWDFAAFDVAWQQPRPDVGTFGPAMSMSSRHTIKGQAQRAILDRLRAAIPEKIYASSDLLLEVVRAAVLALNPRAEIAVEYEAWR